MVFPTPEDAPDIRSCPHSLRRCMFMKFKASIPTCIQSDFFLQYFILDSLATTYIKSAVHHNNKTKGFSEDGTTESPCIYSSRNGQYQSV